MAATPKDLFAKQIPEVIAGKADLANEVNAVYQFDLTGPNGGKYFIKMLKGETPGAGEGEDAGRR